MAETANGQNFIGIGWSFPPTFSKHDATVQMVSGERDIEESLYILLSTTIGERVMQPRYGCNLKQFLFDPANATLEAYIRKLVEDAILYFEPRIRLQQISLTITDGRVDIDVDYLIKTSNSRSNFVYPFYVQEGTTP